MRIKTALNSVSSLIFRTMKHAFDIDRLDHVAIRVKDMDASAAWYEKVLGLKRVQLDKWGDFPIFLLSGKAGIALFPANEEHPELDPASRNVKIDHFAFHVSKENLEKAIDHYKKEGLEYEFQDHFYYHSLYTEDLDGHTLELTSLVVDAESFFK